MSDPPWPSSVRAWRAPRPQRGRGSRLRWADRPHRRRAHRALRTAPLSKDVLRGESVPETRHASIPRASTASTTSSSSRNAGHALDSVARQRGARRTATGSPSTPRCSPRVQRPAVSTWREQTWPASTTCARSTTRCGFGTPSGAPDELRSSAPGGSVPRSRRPPARWALTSCSSIPPPVPLQGVLGDDDGCRVPCTCTPTTASTLRLGTGVAELRGTEAVDAVILDDGRVEAADVVVVGIGVTPRTELADAPPALRVDNGVVVDERLETSVAGVFAPATSPTPGTLTTGGTCGSSTGRTPSTREPPPVATPPGSRETYAGCRTSSPTSTTWAWSTSATPTPEDDRRRSGATSRPSGVHRLLATGRRGHRRDERQHLGGRGRPPAGRRSRHSSRFHSTG